MEEVCVLLKTKLQNGLILILQLILKNRVYPFPLCKQLYFVKEERGSISLPLGEMVSYFYLMASSEVHATTIIILSKR